MLQQGATSLQQSRGWAGQKNREKGGDSTGEGTEGAMNIYQRIVLIGGAVGFVVLELWWFLFWTTKHYDSPILLARGIWIALFAVIPTVFIWWALSGIGKKQQ